MSFTETVIRFGIVPGKNQTPSEKCKDLGINLCRVEPSKVNIAALPTTFQPNYAIYKDNLALFFAAAMTGGWVSPSGTKFAAINYPRTLPTIPIPYPALYISWATPVSEETRARLAAIGFRDGMSKMVPVLVHDSPTEETYRLAKAEKPLSTTPAPENGVNMFAFQRCVVVKRLLSTFLRVHQYPAFIDKDHEEEFNKRFESGDGGEEARPGSRNAAGETEDDEDIDMDTTIKKGFRVNLATPFKDAPTHWDEHSAPEGAGLLFEYSEHLTKFDRTTVLGVVSKYFLHCLGSDEEDAMDEFRELVGSWGIIQNTEFGNQMAHIFKIVDIAITCQAQVCPIITANRYDGVFLRGAGYVVRVFDTEYTPQSKAAIKEHLPKIDSHANAFWSILLKLDMLEDTRLNAFRTIKTMWKLKELVQAHKLNGGTLVQEAAMKEAKYLMFPGDRVLDATAANIDFALSFIIDPSKDLSGLPSIHHSKLFVEDRTEIAWSVFGDYAPSFLVPGGKVMSLDGPFRVTSQAIRSREGPSAHRDVDKIGVTLVPLSDAIKDLRRVIKDKIVMNPFGNNIVNAAASHMNKTFEKDSCNKILTALRKTVGTSSEVKGTARKRVREDEEATMSRKRNRLADV